MIEPEPHLQLRIARTAQDIRAAQHLRYRVFVEELGGDGADVDHDARLEKDRFDRHVDNLILVDTRRDAARLDHVIGVYRLLPGARTTATGGFYSESEYDLGVLKKGRRTLLELGRSCVHPTYRDGHAMFYLWNGLARYISDNASEILFGVASFHGTDIQALKQPLSLLHHRHLAEQPLRARAIGPTARPMNLMEYEAIDRVAAIRQTPALIKAYLRLGGQVGEGAFVDHAFNTTDVFLVMDTARMSARRSETYLAGAAL